MKLSEHSKDIIDNLVQVMAYLENRHKGYLSVCEDARKEIQILHDLKEKYSDELWKLHVTSTDEIKKLKKENEKLRAALKPFAWHVTTEVLFEDLPDEHVIERCGIKIGDLRAARAALKEMGDE